MADAQFRFADLQRDVQAQPANLLAQEAFEHKSESPTSEKLRGVGAGATLVESAIIGSTVQGARLADLAALQRANPSTWSSYTARDLGSVRGALTNAPSYMGTAERETLQSMSLRGAAKGLAAGATGIAGSIAVDAMFFSDTPRTAVSQLTDIAGLPLVSLLPVNPYAKAAAIVTAHTVGRLYDKYFA